jgi:hypothetical protein
MSYYDKYLKYKNKYLQYKNSLGLNMHGGATYVPPDSVNVNSNNIFHINNLTATPSMSEFAGGAYKRTIKPPHDEKKLVKLLDTRTNTSKTPKRHNSHNGTTDEELFNQLENYKLTEPLGVLGSNRNSFGEDSPSSATDSDSSDSLGI